jgi:hypothetical protein
VPVGSNAAHAPDVPRIGGSSPADALRDTGAVPSRPLQNLAVGGIPGAVVLAHADGFSWDEALMVLAPIALLAGVLLYVNRKLKGGLGVPGEPVDDAPADAEPTGDRPAP